MTLKKRLSLFLTLITMLVLFFTLGAMYVLQVMSVERSARASAEDAVNLCIRNLSLSLESSRIAPEYASTYRAVMDYHFRSNTAYLQNETTSYMLSQDGQYVCNAGPYDPMPHFSFTDADEKVQTVRYTDGGQSLIVSAEPLRFRPDQPPYIVYAVVDVSSLRSRNALLLLGMLFLFLSGCAAAFFCVRLLLGKILRPIETLTRTAAKIAEGNYTERTGYRAPDEIGQLSRSFDHMTDVVEETVSSLNEQLAKKELLLGAMTHELKTPMTSIIGYADSLLHMPLSENQKHLCCERIYENGRRTENLSQKLMELISLTKTDSIEIKPFKTAELIRSLRESLPPRVRLDCRVETLTGDSTLLYSLVRNLIDNALKASDPDSPVDVVIDTDRITVRDYGRGIPKEHLPYVTEPFYRVDKARSRSHGGAGLGLSLCRLIAEKHGGSLEIESQPGRGTQITVYLQLADISRTTCAGQEGPDSAILEAKGRSV